MNVERLKLMVTMLREVVAGTWKPSVLPTIQALNPGTSDVRFDIGTWLRGSVKEGCGFAACAVGHACLDKRFIDQGLFERNGIPRFEPGPDDDGSLFPAMDWSAVKQFFGIDQITVEWLFHGDSYTEEDIEPTPENVAQRIESEIAIFLKGQAAADDQLLKDLQP